MSLHPADPRWKQESIFVLVLVCVKWKKQCLCECVCVYGWQGALGWSHLSADGSGVGVELRRSASLGLSQQSASDSGQWHCQRLVVIVGGHVGDALATVAHFIGGADVEGRVVGWAAGAVAASTSGGFDGVGGGFGQLWGRHGQWGDDRSVQAGDAAGVTGKVLLRDRAAVRPILLTAVVLQDENLVWNSDRRHMPHTMTWFFLLKPYSRGHLHPKSNANISP